jgi:cytoskeletal protein CcmA (bactofilin family)
MSTIDPGLSITGDIFGEDDLTVKGTVKGSIFLNKGTLYVEQTGYIEGEIFAEDVKFAGEILGNITALMSLHVTATANILGNLQAAKIAIDDGARFSGRIEIRDLEPCEEEIQDFKPLSEEEYEQLRRWRLRKNIE